MKKVTVVVGAVKVAVAAVREGTAEKGRGGGVVGLKVQQQV